MLLLFSEPHTKTTISAVSTPTSYSGGPGSKLSPKAGYPNGIFSVIPGKYRDSTLKYTAVTFTFPMRHS